MTSDPPDESDCKRRTHGPIQVLLARWVENQAWKATVEARWDE
jgi:hypothetical protein